MTDCPEDKVVYTQEFASSPKLPVKLDDVIRRRVGLWGTVGSDSCLFRGPGWWVQPYSILVQ